MRRKLAFFLAICMAVSLTGCIRNGEDEVKSMKETECEIALIVEGETLEEDSRDGRIWEGIQSYAQTNGVTCQWFGVAEKEGTCQEVVSEAVSQGARVIVVSGPSDYQQTVFSMEQECLDVSFLFMNEFDLPDDDDSLKSDNVAGIAFKEEEAGYLAGYGAVMEGYRSLGFIGGEETSGSIGYGYGFIQGAEAAAQELHVNHVDVKYHYLGHTQAGDDVTALAAGWYEGGVELIFTACGDAEASVVTAAEDSKGKVITTDLELPEPPAAVIASVEKDLSGAVQKMLTDYYNGEFPGGEIVSFGVAEDGVGISMDAASFEEFSKLEYDKLHQQFIPDAQGNVGLEILTEEVPIVNELPTKAVYISLVE